MGWLYSSARGLPVKRGGEVEGAVGVSGAPMVEQDEDCAVVSKRSVSRGARSVRRLLGKSYTIVTLTTEARRVERDLGRILPRGAHRQCNLNRKGTENAVRNCWKRKRRERRHLL